MKAHFNDSVLSETTLAAPLLLLLRLFDQVRASEHGLMMSPLAPRGVTDEPLSCVCFNYTYDKCLHPADR